MPLTKVKAGSNMYQGWVSHTHTHLAGTCPHQCSYCYVRAFRGAAKERYSGEIRLVEEELRVRYGSGKTIFIEHCFDLFASETPREFIGWILDHCRKWPDNLYVFQTKNPLSAKGWLKTFPPKFLLGCTIETNKTDLIYSRAPDPIERALVMMTLNIPKFVTVEPIMDFDVDVLTDWIIRIKPAFVNIGADSKRHALQEPPWAKVQELILRLITVGIEIREKHNLERLRP